MHISYTTTLDMMRLGEKKKLFNAFDSRVNEKQLQEKRNKKTYQIKGKFRCCVTVATRHVSNFSYDNCDLSKQCIFQSPP